MPTVARMQRSLIREEQSSIPPVSITFHPGYALKIKQSVQRRTLSLTRIARP